MAEEEARDITEAQSETQTEVKTEEAPKKSFKEKLFSREVITYIIAGVLTTVVNLIAKFIFLNLMHIEEVVTTALAWIVAVAFAYVINNYWVFLKGNEGAKTESLKILKFTLGRVATLLIEEAGVEFLLKQGHIDNILGIIPSLLENINASAKADDIKFWIVQLPLQFLVIVLNYFFSKLFVFVTKKDRKYSKTGKQD